MILGCERTRCGRFDAAAGEDITPVEGRGIRRVPWGSLRVPAIGTANDDLDERLLLCVVLPSVSAPGHSCFEAEADESKP